MTPYLRSVVFGFLTAGALLAVGCGSSSGSTDGGKDAGNDAGPDPRAVDLIFVVDNSLGLAPEIAGLEDAFYGSLVDEMEDLGIDYRIVMVTTRGSEATEICIGPPLDTASCDGTPSTTGPLYHYSVTVNSKDGWCVARDSFDGTLNDDFGVAPGGWSEWIRPDALKVFVYLGDDEVTCDTYDDDNAIPASEAAAADFDEDLRALSASVFGTSTDRRYVWFSIVGVEATPENPLNPSDPIQITECSGATEPGTGHQALSVLTEGPRFSVCEMELSAGLILQQIAAEVDARR